MDIIKKILIDDIARINLKEKRDGRLKFNSDFVYKHPYLCLAMLISYIFVLVLMYLTPYFGSGYMIAFTAFFALMSAILMMEIKPVFKFEDIGILDLRVCYNGEWFFSRALSTQAIDEILNNKNISDDFKLRFKHIINNKGEIDFYDVYDLAYLPKKSQHISEPSANAALASTSALR
ncbi:Inner membrane protein ylaC [Yersinia aldovae]|uniref:YlaC family protein n=1 Tax=Yersinia aldovae TaxID=29483 RepID=UPI0005E2F262|nr:YlaC family protein [Yersinia aldovae]CNH08284.1 Inner membrane protein ylaC [Yersinia aldovae]